MCVCVCGGGGVSECTDVKNAGNGTQTREEMSVLEEPNWVLLKALPCGLLRHVTLQDCMRMADFITGRSEFSCCQCCLIS